MSNPSRPSVHAWRRAIIGSDLPAAVKHVAHALGIHMSRAGHECYPSVARLARETSMGRRTVQRSLRVLLAAGWIVADGEELVRTLAGEQLVPRYRAAVPGGATLAPPPTPRGRHPGAGRGRHPGAGATLARAPQDTKRGRHRGARTDHRTDQGGKKPAASSPAAAPRDASWLAPYLDAWQQHAGEISPGRLAKALRPVHDAVGDPARVAYGLSKWLVSGGNARFGPDVFARQWREWIPMPDQAAAPSREDLAIGEWLAEGGAT